ncbi:MAG: beta galactosidase jelly roll domain-containing protein [Cyanobacteriota bacterium]
MIDKLTLNARHCFAVYLNGNEIFSHDSFTSISGTDIDKPITINIPQEYQSDKNSLVLLIQSMGHNKGFEDDANNPRGLLDYHTQPDIHLDWYIKQAIDENILKIDALKYSDKEVKNDKLECAVTKFNFSLDESHQVPLGIVFNNPPFNKANIYLNEILIGHYWRDKGPQNKFYLPESFYYQDGRSNSIKLVIWHRSIDKNKNYTRRLSDVNIYIEPYGVYRLTDLEELK